MTRAQANTLLLLAALMWGAGNVIQQTILEHLGPLLANGLKCAIAALVILPFSLEDRRAARPVDRRGRLLSLTCFVSFTGGTALYQVAFAHTTVTNAGFLVNTCTVFTPAVAWLALRTRPAAVIWPAAALVLTGASLMGGGAPSSLNLGDLLCLCASLCFAVWMVALGEFVTRYGGAGRLTAKQFAFSGALCGLLALLVEANTLHGLTAAMPQLLLLGIASTGIPYLLQAIAQRRTSAAEAAVIVSAEAVFGGCAAYIALGENLSALAATGAALISCGILLVQMPPAWLVPART